MGNGGRGMKGDFGRFWVGWDLGMGGVGCLWGVRRDGPPPTQPAV